MNIFDNNRFKNSFQLNINNLKIKLLSLSIVAKDKNTINYINAYYNTSIYDIRK